MDREIVLDAAREENIPFIMGLLEENGLPVSDIADKRGSIFLARSGDTVVGIGGVEILGEYGLLRSLAIVREQRGRGYGGAVVRELVRRARSAGVLRLYLLTTTAAPFFEGIGFERIEREQAPRPIAETSEFSNL
jgi:amino-acid N-acetyltransferase